MSDDDEHGITAAYYDALLKESVLECPCGFQARGDTWEEAGAELDDHLGD